MNKQHVLTNLVAAGFLLGAATAAHANVVSFMASGTGTDGPESAFATVTTGTNSVTVALSSLELNPTAAGQEVSGIQVFMSNVPTSLTLSSSSGTLINIAPGGGVTPASGPITHWGAVSGTAGFFLAAAGIGAPGGSPVDLIIGSGPYTNANPSITGRNPQIEVTGTFNLAATGTTSTTVITGVTFEFGTGPDSFLPGSPAVTPVPEPTAWALLGTGLLGLAFVCRRKTS